MAVLDPVTLEVLWNRLVSIVDETGATLQRTSFSTIVRESNDFACVILDPLGRSLAQSVWSVPSFTGTLPITLRHMLREYPAEALAPGDKVFVHAWFRDPPAGKATTLSNALELTYLP